MRHTKDVARSPSSQRNCMFSLLDGAAPARSHATRFAEGPPILIKEGRTDLEESGSHS